MENLTAPSAALRLPRWRFDSAAALPVQVLPAYATVALMAVFVAAVVVFTSFTYVPDDLNGPVFSLAGLAAAGVVLRGSGYARIGSGVEAIALFSAISLVAPLCAAILASTNLPLVDVQLAALDRALFFGTDRSDWAYWVVAHEPVFEVVKLVYHSLVVQPAILLSLLFATGREGRGWRLLAAWGIALIISICVFALLPALGSPPYFLDYLDTLNGVRDGSLRQVGTEMLTGIITFPSFHAAAAVLLAWGFMGLGRLAIPMVALNVLMFASASIGSHYLVDLIGGGVVAVFAIWLADKVVGRIGREVA